MSFNKPEKDYGEGPVRIDRLIIASNPHRLIFGFNFEIESTQNPNYSHVQKSAIFRKSVPGANRASKVQGFAG